MAEAALPQNAAAIDTSAIYEPSLFGTYSKKNRECGCSCCPTR